MANLLKVLALFLAFSLGYLTCLKFNKEVIKCPGGQVKVNGLCFTPGVSYLDPAGLTG